MIWKQCFKTNLRHRAGVIGLSVALRLQEDGQQVTIVARDLPGPFETIDPRLQINYTSPWGGAHNRWVPPTNLVEQREHQMALHTFEKMLKLQGNNSEAGITLMPGIEYLEAPSQAYQALTEAKASTMGLAGFRLLKPEEFPDSRVKLGFTYDTWCVNPMVYCSFLLRRFGFRGGKVLKQEIRDPAEVFTMKEVAKVDFVVNCSGAGFNDGNMIVTRGQTCLVANSCPATVTRQNADGSWTFSVPRNFEGGTIIGGTKEPDNWDPEPSSQVRETLLRKFAATYPAILGTEGKMTVIKDIVGRRPTRKGGLRLETEKLHNGKRVIHAYGLGGRGYELSWGVAEGVADLLAKELHSTSNPQEAFVKANL
ncbi:FAD dependent oxidoreductase-like protein [Truncatella angustata]|uniref:FAD dependent oxidoreductase-like protein n=1 Tax=Truncatella angustata TaxID=152316 RepID=A0A9P8US68_9PEZI|nr:FAD dependent oxidoreductase-like protein [Truncatella angustata]KAH6657373.1 FAD dependent oxidoreductase-like protein [Truncatella angustata]